MRHVDVADVPDLFEYEWLGSPGRGLHEDEVFAYLDAVRTYQPANELLVYFVTEEWSALYRLPWNSDGWRQVEVPEAAGTDDAPPPEPRL